MQNNDEILEIAKLSLLNLKVLKFSNHLMNIADTISVIQLSINELIIINQKKKNRLITVSSRESNCKNIKLGLLLKIAGSANSHMNEEFYIRFKCYKWKISPILRFLHFFF